MAWICLTATLIAPAQAVDPYTAVQTIAAVIGLIAGIASGIANAQWEAQASGKLDTIITQNATIIGQLRDLRVFVPQALDVAFKQEVAIKITAFTTLFDQYMKDPNPTPQKFRAMELPLALTSYDVIQRGPSVYLSAAAATTLTLAVFKMDGSISQGERDFFLNTMLTTMRQWASNNDGMFGGAIISQTTERDQHRHNLSSIPRGDVIIHSAQSTMQVITGMGTQNFPCTLNMHADVIIDEANLRQSVTVSKVEGCDTGSYDDRTKQIYAGAYSQRIQGEIDAIKGAQSRIDALSAHEGALKQLISDFEKLM